VVETVAPEPQTIIIEEVYYEVENEDEDEYEDEIEHEDDERRSNTVNTEPYREAILDEYPGADIIKLSLEDDGRAEFKFIYNGKVYEGKMNASYDIIDIE